MSNGSNQRYPGGYGGYGSGPGRDQGSGSEWWRDKDGDDMGEEMRFGEYGDEGESREQYGRGQSGRGQSGGYGGQRSGQQRYGQGQGQWQGQGQQGHENERERWRDEWGAGRGGGGGGGGDRSRSGGGGSSFEQQSSPRYRGSGQGRYDPTDMGGARNPYSSGYAGYDPSGGGVERYGMYGVRDTGREDDWESGQGYGSQQYGGRQSGGQQYGGYGREQGRRGSGAETWRELEARDRSRRGGNEPGYGGGYYGSSSSGGQSYSGGQRAYPGDPGYRQSGTSGYGGSSGQGGRGYGLESYESGGRGGSQYQSGYGSQYGQGQQYGQQASQYGQQGQQYGQQQRRRRVGPKGYQRSDERIREDLCERLSDVPMVDVSQVSVEVSGGTVTLTGTVRERHEKFVIEDIADEVFGVNEVHNQIRVTRDMGSAGAGSEAGGDYRSSSSGGGMSGTSGSSGSSGSTSATSTGSPLSSGTMGTSGTTGSTGSMGTSGTSGTSGTTGTSGSSVSSASGSTPDIGDGLGSTGKGTNR